MDKKDLDFICFPELAFNFPKLDEFCRNHNIDGKITDVERIGNNRLVSFHFDKNGYNRVVRRYVINNELTSQSVENILICDLCSEGFAKDYDSVKKTNYSTPAFDPKTSSFIKEIFRLNTNNMKIENVIFQDPATIVFWEDGTKTVVRAEGEGYDPEKGLAMAISRKALGNNRDYYNTFIHWLKRYKK